MQMTLFRSSGRSALFALLLFITALGGNLFAQWQRAQLIQDAPLLLYPDRTKTPVLMIEKGVVVDLKERESDEWYIVVVHGSRIGDRTGYVEARYLRMVVEAPPSVPPPPAVSPSVPRADSASGVSKNAVALPSPAPTVPTSAPAPERPLAAGSPKPVADVSLKAVRRVFIEPMPGDLDQYISAEITKDLKGRVVVVLDKANADAIMRGVGENKTGVGAAITGRYLGLHDNATASITLVDPNETVVLWASEAGDRSLMWGALARGGQRKVADRLVNNLKKALSEAK